jgi:hypothetical protein
MYHGKKENDRRNTVKTGLEFSLNLSPGFLRAVTWTRQSVSKQPVCNGFITLNEAGRIET